MFEQPEASQEPVSFTVNIESGISDVPVQLSVRTEFLGLDEGTVGQATRMCVHVLHVHLLY